MENRYLPVQIANILIMEIEKILIVVRMMKI